MRRSRLYLILSLCALPLQNGYGQAPEHQSQSAQEEIELTFREAVRFRLPQSDLTSASIFALRHSSVAVPILMEAVKGDLNGDDESSSFVWRASELIAYTASPDAIDAISTLCKIDNNRFAPVLSRSLDYAINRNREYELAFYAVQYHPELSQSVGGWLKKQFGFPLSDKRLAESILRREDAGMSPENNEPLLGLLDASARQQVLETLARVRAIRYRRHQ